MTGKHHEGVKELDREAAIQHLTRWQQDGISVGAYFAVAGAIAGVTMLARIAEISVRIVLSSEDASLSFSLKDARFEYGPLQVFSFPSKRGPAVALTHLPQGLLSADGLHIRLQSGHSLFLCDSRALGPHWLSLVAGSMGELGPGGK